MGTLANPGFEISPSRARVGAREKLTPSVFSQRLFTSILSSFPTFPAQAVFIGTALSNPLFVSTPVSDLDREAPRLLSRISPGRSKGLTLQGGL